MTGLTAQEIELRAQRYYLVKVPRSESSILLKRSAELDSPFMSLLLEADGVSLVVSAEDRESLGDLLSTSHSESDPYRVITFTATLPWNLVGFMARVTTQLAQAEISTGALSGFERDHLFVREDVAQRAVDCLRAAAEEGKLL